MEEVAIWEAKRNGNKEELKTKIMQRKMDKY